MGWGWDDVVSTVVDPLDFSGYRGNKAGDKYEGQLRGYQEDLTEKGKEGESAGESKIKSLYGSSDLAGEYQSLKGEYKKGAEGTDATSEKIKQQAKGYTGKLQQQQQLQGVKGSLAMKQQQEGQRGADFAATEAVENRKVAAQARYAKLLGGEISDSATVPLLYRNAYTAGMSAPVQPEQKGILGGIF